ncbi:restriction endonuclease subunit S [Fibrobacter sp. UWB3]|uniref:restriction endonuclease subunit S n=1 Tax=Fibrobacter sp. UWB3 TaxID=1964357 RepID=UPI000B526DA4|nr:restriction endonuclease subunit S [Fibrobacter sp. UWB3]OWV20844.1 hypothetical protein B7991_06240 [Fibrobacter sp. UWB3]
MELTKVKLSDVARVEISGVDKKSKLGQKSVRLCNFVDVYHNWAITQDLHDSFMEATASDKEIEALSIKKGQVAFTKDSETRDDIGIPTYIADDFDDVVLGYHNALITPDERKLNGKYLNAFMHSSYIQKYFENNASGSGQRYTLSNDTVNSIPILLPSIKEQEKIGNFFSFIDRKIALNKKMNQKLEAMAKRLYDYWFVQFDFPDKNGHPYKSTGGPMTYNPTLKREIPEGWEVKQICDIAKIFNGSTPSTTEEGNYGGEIVWITPKDLSDQNCKFVYQGARNITQAGYDSCSTTMVPKGTVVMSSRAPIGLLSIAQCDLCTNQGFKNMVPNDMTYSKYLYYTIQQHIPQIQNLGTGTTFKEVSKDELGRFAILYPPKKLITTFEEKMAPIFDVQFNKVKEISRLTALRDKLLPLLMNGQVVVG